MDAVEDRLAVEQFAQGGLADLSVGMTSAAV